MPATSSADHRPSVLYITHRVPYPPDKGDRIRNYHVLRQLAARADVHLIALADEPVPLQTHSALAELCADVAIVPVSPRRRWVRAGLSAMRGRSLTEGLFTEPAAHSVLKKWVASKAFTGAIVSAAGLAGYLARHPVNGPRVVDLVDVDSQKWLDYSRQTSSLKRYLYAFEGRRLRRWEAALAGTMSAVAVVSRAEADVYDQFTRSGAALVAYNGVDLDYFTPTPADAPTEQALAFVGAMDYLPNVDAAIWFADTIWPQVRGEFPNAEFRIVGRKPTAAVQRLSQRAGIVVTGSVADVRSYVASATAAVVPMRLSRGLQNKVLEAMALAKPVIAAPPALAALNTVPGRDLLRATEPAEWLAHIRELFCSPERYRELGQAGRKYVEEHHQWNRCLRPLIDAVVGVSEAK